MGSIEKLKLSTSFFSFAKLVPFLNFMGVNILGDTVVHSKIVSPVYS